eukprot:Gb_06839 [translate_table: standard]
MGISSNNVVEAKALRKDLRILMEKGVWRVKIYGGSHLIINLVQDRWVWMGMQKSGPSRDSRGDEIYSSAFQELGDCLFEKEMECLGRCIGKARSKDGDWQVGAI